MGFIKFVLKKFKATVINDIWFELVFFTSVAAVVTAVSEFVHPLGISNQLLTVLGTVLGLVVSFRTSSAYDRYWEGRKLWSAIALASRNLAQIIWLHVPNERKGQQGPEARLKAIIEKKSMINLAQAYSVAMKHYLRGEEGIYYEDLYPLVSFLPRYAGLPKPTSVPLPEDENSEGKEETEKGNVDDGILPLWWVSPESTMPKAKKRKNKPRKFNPESALPQVHSDIPLRPARNPPKDTVYDYLPFLIPFKWLIGLVSHKVKERGEERSLTGKRVQPKKVDSNVPLEVVLFLSSYLSWLLANGLLQSPLATAFSNQLQSFQDSLTHLSRVRNTPIPFAYQVHLRMALWMYLFFLPFEVYNAFGWLTIPATTFASFLILGFLEIGQEIENPFSYEPNDLDLDGFCLEIQREIHEVTTHTVLDPSSFIYNELNQPFAPADRRTAEEILEGDHSVGYGDSGADASGTLRQTLVKNWKEVNEVTREVRWKPSTAF